MRTLPLLGVSTLALVSFGLACRNAEPPASPRPSAAPAPATAQAAPPAPQGAAVPAPSSTAPSSPAPASSAPVANDAPATAACGWSADKAPVTNWRTLVHADDPSYGPANARVTVVEFFEPNCPHCQTLHPTIKMVQRAFPDVRFVYKPVVFWPHSMTQAHALYAAHAGGAFEAVLDAQMTSPSPQGLQEAQLRPMLAGAGLDAEATLAQVRAGAFRTKMMANRQDFAATGITTVPLVLINGKVMGSDDRSTGCFGQLLREAAAG